MDIELKGIPAGISENDIREWVAILVERKYNADIQKIPELVSAQEKAKTDIDSYRLQNSLHPKFSKPEEIKDAVVE